MNNINGITIDETIKQTIKSRGYTLSEIADALNINKNTLYSKLRRLQTSDMVDMELLTDIAGIIGVDVLDLVFGVDTKNAVMWFNNLIPEFRISIINKKKYKLINTKTKKEVLIDNEQLAFLRRQLEKMIYNYIDDFIKII